MEIKDYALVGFNRLLECARQAASECDSDIQDEVEECIEYFKNSIIEYAGIYESGDEQLDLDSADGVLWEDGWCYPNDTFDCIYELTSNVAEAVGKDEEEIFYKED